MFKRFKYNFSYDFEKAKIRTLDRKKGDKTIQDHTERVNYFKEAMANYPTGVSVVTIKDDKNTPVGITVNSFASVSLDPLLILWSIDNNASTYDQFMDADKFAVNILAEEQAEIASLFASRKKDGFENCE